MASETKAEQKRDASGMQDAPQAPEWLLQWREAGHKWDTVDQTAAKVEAQRRLQDALEQSRVALVASSKVALVAGWAAAAWAVELATAAALERSAAELRAGRWREALAVRGQIARQLRALEQAGVAVQPADRPPVAQVAAVVEALAGLLPWLTAGADGMHTGCATQDRSQEGAK